MGVLKKDDRLWKLLLDHHLRGRLTERDLFLISVFFGPAIQEFPSSSALGPLHL